MLGRDHVHGRKIHSAQRHGKTARLSRLAQAGVRLTKREKARLKTEDRKGIAGICVKSLTWKLSNGFIGLTVEMNISS